MSQTSEPTPPRSIERILVALDASPHSLYALRAAADLASLLDAELLGLFIEDDNLLRLAGLPFLREIGSYSAAPRPLDRRTVERGLKLQASHMRRAMAQTAVDVKLRWSFQVVRGKVSEQLLAATESVGLVTLGRVGRSPGKRYGSTAQSLVRLSMCPVFLLGEGGLSYPLTVVYTGSPASERALALASLLAQHQDEDLRILCLAGEEEARLVRASLSDQLGDLDAEVQVQVLGADDNLLDAVHAVKGGLLILPAEQVDVIESLARSAIVVP